LNPEYLTCGFEGRFNVNLPLVLACGGFPLRDDFFVGPGPDAAAGSGAFFGVGHFGRLVVIHIKA
jgi:hypothetical protein